MRPAILKRFAVAAIAPAFVLALSSPAAAAGDPPAGYEAYETPQDLPAITFENRAGETLGLDAFHGEIVVLNFWAAWCAPCVREMGSLDLLHRALDEEGVEVVAVSIDDEGIEAVQGFYNKNGILGLDIYTDPSWDSFRALAGDNTALPFTLIVDKQGKALGVLKGPASWHAGSVKEYLRDLARETEARVAPQVAPTFAPQVAPAVLFADAGDGLENPESELGDGGSSDPGGHICPRRQGGFPIWGAWIRVPNERRPLSGRFLCGVWGGALTR